LKEQNRLREVMAGSKLRTLLVFFVLFSMTAMPIVSTQYVVNTHYNISEELAESKNEIQLFSQRNIQQIDISPWRISDKWAYDTVFDVAGLIADANLTGASVNSLTGDTDFEVQDIIFLDINGTQTLVYELKIEGDFTSGNNGATFPNDGSTVTGRLDVEYLGHDYVRVSDLATVRNEFEVEVTFAPYNLGFFSQDLGDIQVNNTYWPPREDYDFPLMMGDTWNATYYTETEVTGVSDYFDVSGLDSNGTDTTLYQVTHQGTPTEDGSGITYSGCNDAMKISTWNSAGEPGGFKWYCPNSRSYAWNSFQDQSLGLQIDWKLKSYNPTDSQGVSASSSPGIRQTVVESIPQFDRVRPDTILGTWGNYSSNLGQNPQINTNLQLRWEHEGIIQSLTTASNGSSWTTIDVGHSDDNTTVNDDEGSHGLIIWDPVAKIVGVKTVVLDPLVTAIDLIAKQDGVIVQRNRSGVITNLNPDTITVLPGDSLQFWLITQNRGTQVSPATQMEVSTPDGSSNQTNVPPLPPLGQATITTNWTVPAEQPIGNITLTFEVDPDELVTEDANRSNNLAQISMFVGRAPIVSVTVYDEVYTHANATINASASYDPDGGEVECDFAIDEDKDGIFDVMVFSENCTLEWAWIDDGEQMVWIYAYDMEGDVGLEQVNVTILNQVPWISLSGPESVPADSEITITADDYGDNDSYVEPVSISWPNSMCEEGVTQPTCTFSVFEETNISVLAIATDEDGATTSTTFQIGITNMPPILESVELWIDGVMSDNWTVMEDQVVELRATGNDTSLDLPLLVYDWHTDIDLFPEMSIATSGENSIIETSWNTSGTHRIQVELFDDDGVSGGLYNHTINVTNVLPTIPEISPPLPAYEDQEFSLLGSAIDSASDTESLVLCWDIDVEENSDGNGTSWDDCDVEGTVLTYSFVIRGVHVITFHATDDDGASGWQNISVTTINKAPTASITSSFEGDSISIEEGGSITFYGNESDDTLFDQANLWMWWDSTCHDGDSDGILVDDIDEEASFATFAFASPGICTITLHVEDDDGESDSTSMTVEVTEKPLSSALLSNIASGKGIIIGLGIVFAALLLVFVITRRKQDYSESITLQQSNQSKAWDLQAPSQGILSHASGAAPMDSYERELNSIDYQSPPPTAQPTYQPAAQPVAQPTYQPAAQPVAQPAVVPAQQPAAQPAVVPAQQPAAQPVVIPTSHVPAFPPPASAPPIPAQGLPPGWSQEQWLIYGEKWLEEQNKIASTPSRAGKDMSELLDDLDF
jgi:hypothetical protein